MDHDRMPVRRLEESADAPLSRARWPATIPAVAHVLDHGLDLGAVTVLVGDNGAGKSTLVEAVAGAFNMSPEGGSTGARHFDPADRVGPRGPPEHRAQPRRVAPVPSPT